MPTTQPRKFTIIYRRGINGVQVLAQCFYCKVLLESEDANQSHTQSDCNFNTHNIGEGDDYGVWCTECKLTDYTALTETECQAHWR